MQRLVYESVIREVVERTRLECVGIDDVLAELKARWETKIAGAVTVASGTIDTDEGAVLTQVAKFSRKGDAWKIKMHAGIVQIDGAEFVMADGSAVLDADLRDG